MHFATAFGSERTWQRCRLLDRGTSTKKFRLNKIDASRGDTTDQHYSSDTREKSNAMARSARIRDSTSPRGRLLSSLRNVAGEHFGFHLMLRRQRHSLPPAGSVSAVPEHSGGR